MTISLTQRRLHELLSYDAETGALTWLQSRGTRSAGSVAGSRKKSGHIALSIDGRAYQAHRVVWLYVHGAWPEGDVDHRNGVRHDNRLSNLRDVPRSVNKQNTRSAYTNNASGYLGVHRSTTCDRWAASICVSGRTKHLGLFRTPELASAAYLAAKRQLHEGCTI